MVSQPQASPARAPRVNLDSLAIGAPLTAALVGLLLTEGEGALGNAAPGAAPGGPAARQGEGEAGAPWHHEAAHAQLGPAVPGALAGQSAASTSGELFDPILASGASAAPENTGSTPAGTLLPPGAPVPNIDGQTTVSAETNITLGGGGAPLDGFGLDGSAADGASSIGRIGATITGTAGDDVIHGTPNDDRLFGGAGNDTIFGHEGDDLLDGGAGDDLLDGGPGRDTLLGGTGEDELFGGSGDDRLLGGNDDDRLFGQAGRDSLDGGSGSDRLDGGLDPDRMSGGTGDDILIVDNIHDVAFGSGPGIAVEGADTLVVQAGFATHLLDQLGESRATFTFSENFGQTLPSGVAGHTQQVAGDIQNITLQGTADHDVVADSRANEIWGNDGDNRLYGEAGDDVLHGGGGDDLLRGDAGDDELYGEAGNDALQGGAGDDILRGGAGDDVLNGGPGADLLYGDVGNDNFVIGLNDSGADTLFDHEGSNRLTIQGGAGHQVRTALAGDDLYVVVDDNVTAVINGYRGHEDAWAGIDSGAGVVPISNLMAPGAAQGPALDATAPAAAGSSVAPHDDLLEAYLSQPSLFGTSGADHLVGTSGADWLVGNAGNDHLIGNAGNDILEGGRGSNLLEGGAGDDRYLFRADDAGFATIRDADGANVAVLDGFGAAGVKGVVSGNNLLVVANNAHLFTFEDYVGHEQALAGVQIGDQFIPTEEFA